MPCGGPSAPSNNTSLNQPALSLYCINPQAAAETDGSNSSGSGAAESYVKPLLSEEGLEILRDIESALRRDGTLTEFMMAIITLLVIILTSIVTYLCYTRGISSLSKYVM